MHTPFTPPAGDFGFGPAGRRAMHERRAAVREFRDQMRAHLHEAREQGLDPRCEMGPAGPGGMGGPGRGFGFGFGFDPGAGFGFGPGPRGRRGHGRGRRGRRGDVRAAILKLLAERPMHGYEMIQEIAERTDNLWRPSPGSVYPTLQLLVDEGLITGTETEGSKKLFELTEEGRAAADQVDTPPWDQINEDVDPAAVNLRAAIAQLMGAVAQSAYTATEDQQQRILDVVNNARREIYQILGEE
ncbi:PadR family transcriptional regulator [Mycolicibacterium goodii]|uniref:PadR family transcriptional regulator n=1 Tax=Mycolicibacterium goodii TaxID=134601 RepID=A0A0K0X0U9_MYCGD|nr:PadR family transcriptional regulator [Mycolicibacterium goodii]